MIAIDNPILEEFYKNECKNDKRKFMELLVDFVENYKIKQSIKNGFDDVYLMQNGLKEKKELKSFLDEI